MSTTDTLAPLVSSPWLDRHGNPLSIQPLSGLRAEVLRDLKLSFHGLMNPAYREFLSECSGLTCTALGHVDSGIRWKRVLSFIRV
jgi:hypothetical protein